MVGASFFLLLTVPLPYQPNPLTMPTYHSTSPEHSHEIAIDIADDLKAGAIVTLTGELGAGKTTFAKGFAEGLGVTSEISSPTFTLMDIHQFSLNGKACQFVHVDTYRGESAEDFADIGLEEYLGAPDTICLIEWPEKIAPLLANKQVLSITIAHVGEKERKIDVS